MNTPTNPTEVGKKFPEVSPERQAALVEHIAALPDASTKVVDQIIANGGSEGQFVAALFNRTTPGKADAPNNKAMPSMSKPNRK